MNSPKHPLYTLLFLCFSFSSLAQSEFNELVKTFPDSTFEAIEQLKNNLFYKGNFLLSLEVDEWLEDSVFYYRGENGEQILAYINELAFLSEYNSLFEKALGHYNRALELCAGKYAQENFEYCLITRSNCADLYRQLGQFEKAEALFVEAINYCESQEKPWFGCSGAYAMAGTLYRMTGQFEKGLPLFHKGKEIFDKHYDENHPDYHSANSNLGLIYEDLGLYSIALEYHKAALKNVKSNLGEDHPFYGSMQNNLSSCYKNMGQNEKALELQKGALENAAKAYGKDHVEYGIRLGNLGNNYLGLEQFDTAIIAYKEGLENIKKNIGEENTRHPHILFNLTKAYWLNGQRDSANFYFNKARNNKGLGENNAITGMNAADFSRFYEESGNIEASQKLLQEANEIMQWNINHRFDHFNEREQISFNKQLQIIFNALQSFLFRNPESSEIKELAINNYLILKGLLLGNRKRLLNSLRNSSNLTVRDYYLEWSRLQRTLNFQYSLSPKRRIPEFDSLENRVNFLEGELARASLQFQEARQQITWRDVQENLEENQIAIEFGHFQYLPLNSDSQNLDSTLYVAWLIEKNASTPKMIPLFEQKDLGRLNEIRRLYQSTGKGSLHELIWKPLAPYLSKYQSIVYANTGALHRINFGAIPVSNTEIISNKFQLHNIGSTRQLNLNNRNDLPVLKSAILFGDIQYDKTEEETTEELETLALNNLDPLKESISFRSPSGNSWEALSWTKNEVEDLAHLLDSTGIHTRLLTQGKASETAFKNLGAPNSSSTSPQILHLATHGYFFPDVDTTATTGFGATKHPLIRSGLILAGANHVWTGGQIGEGQEDGILTAYEIAQLDLSNTELVVLSACETGLGDIEGNEGVYGLQRAFKIAGVKHILMSLWQVSDKQTYQLMTSFYKNWQSGQSIPEAFTQAQNELKLKYREPYFWAGFVLIE